jgi:hypothetical protein
VDGQAAQEVAGGLDLSDVNAAADLQPESGCSTTQCHGATDRPGRRVD